MAPAKRGAPASAAKREKPYPFNRTKEELAAKRAANRAKHVAGQAAAIQAVKDAKAELLNGWPLKPQEYWGKDDPALPTETRMRQGPVGRRPVARAKYTPELGELLYELVSTGNGLDTISRLAGTPGLMTMLGWLSS